MIFNMSSGGGKKCPVLDEQYPESVSINATESATFQVKIAEDGKPNAYTYQWYYDGNAVSGATSAVFIKTTTKNDGGSHLVYCEVTSEAGTVTSSTATLSVDDTQLRTPEFTYDGTYELTDDSGSSVGQNVLCDNWKLTFKTGGSMQFTSLNSAADGIEAFLVGGGGSGGAGGSYGGGGGGGGGYITTQDVNVESNTDYVISIGGSNGNTTAFGLTANTGGKGGAGGNSSGAGNGGNGGAGTGYGGKGGQGKSGSVGSGVSGGAGAYEFSDSNGGRFGGGGGGGAGQYSEKYGTNGAGGAGGGGSGGGGKGTANTGGGGGGGKAQGSGGSGGSGIVIIRNKRS